ncbi:MAG: hypothetical protein SWX82_33760 [Cyanobacteriota bacterium]|nr:hypothetical protein [Cyanobacteriota bacterium]
MGILPVLISLGVGEWGSVEWASCPFLYLWEWGSRGVWNGHLARSYIFGSGGVGE